MSSGRPHSDRVAGRYTQGDYVGGGGFGQVWEGRDERTGERVAIKWIGARTHGEVHAAQVEIVTLRRLALPGVVRLRHEGRDGEWWYIVMDFVEGRHFPGAARTWEALEPLVCQLLEVLVAVHAQLVHGDLKPANVLVRPDGTLLLLDFGVARGRTLPKGGMYGGTQAYMPPEPASLRDARADLYAVGVMVFEALGRPRVVSHTQSTEADPAPCAALPNALEGLPARARALVESLVASDPADRPASAHAALLALGRSTGRVPHLPARASEEELRALFSGPEPFLHLPSMAARLLHACTGGAREGVERELEGWLAKGVVVPDGGRLLPIRARLEAAESTPEERAFEAMLREASAEDVAREALRVAAHWRTEGRPRRAVMVLERAFEHVRDTPDALEWEEPILQRWAAAALVQETSIAASAALCALRSATRPERHANVERLLLAMEAHRDGGDAEPVAAFADEELESWRLALELMRARREGREEAALDALRGWARTPWRRARWEAMRANRLYVDERFLASARGHLRSARARTHRDERIASELNAAMAFIELPGGLRRALGICERNVREARLIRHAEYELLATRRARGGSYRDGGRLVPPSPAEVRAGLDVDPVQGGLLAMTVAASALRLGERAVAAQVATEGERALRGARRVRPAVLCHGIALAARGGSSAEVDALCRAAEGTPDAVRMQVLALASVATDPPSPALLTCAREIARSLRGGVGRLEVLGPEEVLSGEWSRELAAVGRPHAVTH